MRIVALTFGTEGDTRPMLALCRGLIDAGYEVLVLAERSGAAHAHSLGVPFVALDGDMKAELLAATDLWRHGEDVKHVARELSRIGATHAASWMRTTLSHARGAHAILCAGIAIYVGLSCAEALGIPAIGVALQPMMPTRAFGSPFLPLPRLPRFLNRASHRIVLAMLWRAFRGAINDARRDVANQPPRRREWDGYPILFGMSPPLVPRPADWPSRFFVTGYWWLPHDDAFQPDADLAAFLGAGEVPIYVGFGSMIGFDRERMLAIVLDALDGRRALVQAGWSDFGRGALSASVHRIGPMPHAWLFPRTRIVVHHGGAGTTHSAARSGVPSVVIPLAADQFFWADRLHRLGVAPKGLPHRDASASALDARLRAADASAMHARAREVGESIAKETGVANAIARIDALLSRRATA
ncbi:MAG TPA: glycosyltransferase [Casimicrobiaceae bacterium]|nr:glycosyltransferase [Casimicrobiaceae bacterium]